MIDYQQAWNNVKEVVEQLRDHYEALERVHPSAVSTARAETVSVVLSYMDLAIVDQEGKD